MAEYEQQKSELQLIKLTEKHCFPMDKFLAVQDSSITDIVCRSVGANQQSEPTITTIVQSLQSLQSQQSQQSLQSIQLLKLIQWLQYYSDYNEHWNSDVDLDWERFSELVT